MKNKLYPVLFSLLLLGHSSFAQWRWLHPAPQGNSILKLSFISTSTGWAAGEKGALIKTTNGGQSWTLQYAGIIEDIRELQFTDSLHGFLADRVSLLTSTNSGNSWNIKYRFPSNIITALYMFDSDSGFVGLSDGFGNGELLKTTDGGSNWSSVMSNVSGEINDIEIYTNGTGILAGTNGLVMRTTDYGLSWNSITVSGITDIIDVSISGGQTIFMCSSTDLFKSTNGGQTFASIGNPGSGAGVNILSIDFGNANNGVVGCEFGNIYSSNNGGSSWNQYVSNSWFNPYAVIANSGTNYFVGGSGGSILKSNNTGNTWNEVSTRVSETRLNAVNCISTSTVYAAGVAGTILTSGNGGTTWTAQASNAGGEDLNDILFLNANLGISVGSNGTIVKTTDGGANWNFVFSGIGENLHAIAQAGPNKLYVCGANGKLAYSTDNGDTWTDLPTSFSGFGYAFTDIQCFGTDTIIMTTDQPYLVTTYDNGISWNLQNNGSSFECSAMYFRNGMNGWIGTTVGEVFSTTDGGNNWNLDLQNSNNYSIGCIKFTDPQNGWIFAGNEIFRTADGGLVWGTEINPNQDPLYDMDFLVGTNAIAVGDGLSTILARSNDMQLSLPTNIFCTDNSYTLAINAIGSWNLGNQFRIELSDEFGEFIFPTTLGSVSATGTTPVQINVPNGLTDGTDYRIRIFSTNPTMFSPLNSAPLEIRTSPDAYITAGGPTAFCIGSSVTLYAFTGPGWIYQWYKDGVLINGANADTLFVDQTGNYTVNVSDGICNLTSPISDVLVINCSGVAENGNAEMYKLFPNPAKSAIQIRTVNDNSIEKIIISDVTGRIVDVVPVSNSSNVYIDISTYPSGIYQAAISGNKPAVLKFVKL